MKLSVNSVELPAVKYRIRCTKTTNSFARDKDCIVELPSNVIKVGESVLFDSYDAVDYGIWRTSLVKSITLLSKNKVEFNTLNSTYLLEERI